MQADARNARIVTESPRPARCSGLGARWPISYLSRGQITASRAYTAYRSTATRLRVLVLDSSTDPVWAPDGSFVVYTGPDVGHPVFRQSRYPRSRRSSRRPSRANPDPESWGSPPGLPFPASRALLFLRGEIQHKDLWRIDLDTGAERQLTNVAPDFDIATSTSPRMAGKLFSNARRSIRTSFS